MRLTLEKVLILKKVPLFAGIPEAALNDVIAASEEVSAMMGSDIVKPGDLWNDMYIILQGQVRMHHDGKTIEEHNSLDYFGELSALDAAPSALTVTALEDTTMFKINGPALYRLMNDHKALERSIIQMLCKRIRSMRERLAEIG